MAGKQRFLMADDSLGVDATEHHFTDHEHDVESANDFMLARYYNSTTGRFLTPDWSLKAEPVPYARLDIPQTLNLYAYVGNNPLTHTDVDGHQGPSPYIPCASDPLCIPQADQKSDSEISAEKTDAKSAGDARQVLQQGARPKYPPESVTAYANIGGCNPSAVSCCSAGGILGGTLLTSKNISKRFSYLQDGLSP
jgi:RHS repeat-associated protein